MVGYSVTSFLSIPVHWPSKYDDDDDKTTNPGRTIWLCDVVVASYIFTFYLLNSFSQNCARRSAHDLPQLDLYSPHYIWERYWPPYLRPVSIRYIAISRFHSIGWETPIVAPPPTLNMPGVRGGGCLLFLLAAWSLAVDADGDTVCCFDVRCHHPPIYFHRPLLQRFQITHPSNLLYLPPWTNPHHTYPTL